MLPQGFGVFNESHIMFCFLHENVHISAIFTLKFTAKVIKLLNSFIKGRSKFILSSSLLNSAASALVMYCGYFSEGVQNRADDQHMDIQL